MRFSYVVFDKANKIKKGIIEASNLKQATQLLLDNGWFVRKITPRGAHFGFGEISIGGVSTVEKTLFVKHLSTMIKSGISINEALEVVSQQTSSKKFQKILLSILESVQTGQTLAKSLSKFSKQFDPLFINIIRVGEESGTLEANLEYLAGEMEERLELQRNIKAAAFYPSLVLIATFGLGLVLSYFVLPNISRLFQTLSFELPLSTKILLWFAEVMEAAGLWIILGFIVFIFLMRFVTKLKAVQPAWHWLLIKTPIIGRLIIHYNLVLINRTMNILLKSGLTIDRSIEITIDTTANMVYKKRLQLALPQVRRGTQLSQALASMKQSRHKPLFSLLVTKMISVGEKSGRLEESFDYIAEYYEKEVTASTKNLTTVLEPVLLIGVGLAVGFIAISIIMPIYQVTGRFNTPS